jgi:predicted secreted protein
MISLRRLLVRLRGGSSLHDGRSGRVILVPHCVLNQNARMPGTAERPAAVVELVMGLLTREIGILQMPCPEMCAFGVDRAHVRVENELRKPAGKTVCRSLARDLAKQIGIYLGCGIQVLGVLGKNGSPSCGVEETWKNGWCAGPGAFIEELVAELKENGLAIEMAGIRDSEPDKAIAVVERWLANANQARSCSDVDPHV